MEPGCPPGSVWFTAPSAPPFGAPSRCPSGKCPDDQLAAQFYRLLSGHCQPTLSAFACPPSRNACRVLS
jgi:hypothetical protein